MRLVPITNLPEIGHEITIQNVFDLVNAQRATAGLLPLTENLKLDGAAKDVLVFLEQNSGANNDPTGILQGTQGTLLARHNYLATHFAENYAHASARNTVQDVITGWMSWPPNKAAMTSSQDTETGIAVDGLWVVQVYAEPNP